MIVFFYYLILNKIVLKHMSHRLLCYVVFVFCFSFIGDKLLKSPEISADFKQMQRVLTAHSLPCERGIVCEADAWFRRAH